MYEPENLEKFKKILSKRINYTAGILQDYYTAYEEGHTDRKMLIIRALKEFEEDLSHDLRSAGLLNVLYNRMPPAWQEAEHHIWFEQTDGCNNRKEIRNDLADVLEVMLPW